jgi:hypothetical protein
MSVFICFFGSPGSGKTTAATSVFSHLKAAGKSAAYLQEYATQLIYQGKNPMEENCFFHEHTVLNNTKDQGYDYVISDSSILCAYAYEQLKKKPHKGMRTLMNYALLGFSKSYLIHLPSNEERYKPEGRVTPKGFTVCFKDAKTYLTECNNRVELLEMPAEFINQTPAGIFNRTMELTGIKWDSKI